MSVNLSDAKTLQEKCPKVRAETETKRLVSTADAWPMFASDSDASTQQLGPGSSCIIPQQSFIPLTSVLECRDTVAISAVFSTQSILLSPPESLVHFIIYQS